MRDIPMPSDMTLVEFVESHEGKAVMLHEIMLDQFKLDPDSAKQAAVEAGYAASKVSGLGATWLMVARTEDEIMAYLDRNEGEVLVYSPVNDNRKNR